MLKPPPPGVSKRDYWGVSQYAVGERRIRRGWFGFAVCEIKVKYPGDGLLTPERSYWKRANAAEWEWCAVADNNITIKMDADTSRLTAEIAEAMADREALAEKAGSLGIVIEVDDGEAADAEVAECDLFYIRAVAAVVDAHRRNPHLFR